MSDLKRLTLVTTASEMADFPTHFEAGDADELLAGWTALWHPALLAAAGSLPIIRADYDLPDPQSVQGELAVVPSMFVHGDVITWCEELGKHPDRHSHAIKGVGGRQEIIAASLAALGKPDDPIDSELAADFYALGYAFLQVEMLTRLMRYSHLIEPEKLLASVISAANAALEGQAEQARESIASACDMLTQARNHYYPVDVYFVDVALIAESVWGEPLRNELAATQWSNILATGEQLERLAAVEPESAAALRAALSAKPPTACLIGGAYASGAISQRSPEATLADFKRGRQAALDTLGHAPRVHAHFHSGLAPLLPRVLADFEFKGTLLTSFDGGFTPRADQCRTTWTGPDGATVEALVTTPHDAGKPETFLRLAESISNAMDHDHVATILLAGWPGHRSDYLDAVRRISRFGPVLGRFITLDEYFESTVASDYGFTTKLDDFGATQSKDDTIRSEILETHEKLLIGLADIAATSANVSRDAEVPYLSKTARTVAERVVDSIAQILNAFPADSSPSVLAINAWNFDRTISQESIAVPNVSGFGFAIAESKKSPPPVPLVEGLRLRNEFLEVLLDEKTGGIQSVHFHNQRGNLFSQQLVYRALYRHPDEYESDLRQNLVDRSRMEVVEFLPSDSPHEASVTSVGRLVSTDNDAPIATFRQTVRLPRQTRVVQFEFELTPSNHTTELSTTGHFASRIAWRDSDPAIARAVQWMNLPTFRRKFSSAPWTRIDSPTPLTVISDRASEFERIGERMLDTKLPNGVAEVGAASLQRAAGEGFAALRPQPPYVLSIAVGEPFPGSAALGLLTGSASGTVGINSQPPRKGWWLHFAAENLVVTHLSLPSESSRIIELRALETMGLATHTTLRLWRPITEAYRTTLAGEQQEPLRIIDGCVELEIAPYEWLGINVRCEM